MANPIVVTATLQDPSGNPLTNADATVFLRFRLRNFQGWVPQVANTSVIVETQIDAFPNSSGIVTQSLWANNSLNVVDDEGNPATWWTVEAWRLGRITWSGNYIFDADTSLNTASQLNPPPGPPLQGPIFENNGTLNSSQIVLNLTAGQGVALTDTGSGALEITANGGADLGNPGFGYFMGTGIVEDVIPVLSVCSTSETIITTPDEVRVQQFVLESTWVISAVGVTITGTDASQTCTFGIYSAAGNKLVDSGAFSAVSMGYLENTLGSPVTLPPGVYYFAQSATGSNPRVPGIGTNIQSSLIGMLNGTNTYNGIAANSASGGVLPSTLGVLTPTTQATWTGIALPMFIV